MKIIRFVDREGREQLGTHFDNGSAELLAGSLFGKLRKTGRRVAVGTLLAPISPPNIFGIGLNYREHARQMGVEIPDHPVVFMKPTTAVTHPGAPILLPKCCDKGPEVDYECELAVIIGRTAREVRVGDALDYVFGYTAANDVSARKWSKVSRTRGKIFDGFCPLGPAIVTSDEISDPQNLELNAILNGAVMQCGNTADMIFSVAQIVSHLSQDLTLLPGTVILTGTPPGSGMSQTPPRFLKHGDNIVVEIEKIGRLTNGVQAHVADVLACA